MARYDVHVCVGDILRCSRECTSWLSVRPNTYEGIEKRGPDVHYSRYRNFQRSV